MSAHEGVDDVNATTTGEPSATWQSVWQSLVSAAIIGVDRRDLPALEIGAVADFVDDTVATDPATRLISAVSATAVARRAGFTPLPVAPPLDRPPADPRPILPALPARLGADAIARWPILEDEWLISVIRSGWRLPADLVVSGLGRTRADALRRARVVVASGDTAEWLADVFPPLAPTFAQRSTTSSTADAPGRSGASSSSQPAAIEASILDVPDDLSVDVAELAALDARTLVDRLTARILQADGSATAERKILTTLMARVRPAVLIDAIDALNRLGSTLSIQLADLARWRHRMLESLAEVGPAPFDNR